jgi:hypothetical protein
MFVAWNEGLVQARVSSGRPACRAGCGERARLAGQRATGAHECEKTTTPCPFRGHQAGGARLSRSSPASRPSHRGRGICGDRGWCVARVPQGMDLGCTSCGPAVSAGCEIRRPAADLTSTCAEGARPPAWAWGRRSRGRVAARSTRGRRQVHGTSIAGRGRYTLPTWACSASGSIRRALSPTISSLDDARPSLLPAIVAGAVARDYGEHRLVSSRSARPTPVIA